MARRVTQLRKVQAMPEAVDDFNTWMGTSTEAARTSNADMALFRRYMKVKADHVIEVREYGAKWTQLALPDTSGSAHPSVCCGRILSGLNMPAALRDDFIGLDEYERLCEQALEGERLEYVEGQVVRMMVGGSTAHHALTRRLDNLISDRLVPGGPCASFRETMRLQAGTARFYPDVFIACGDAVEPDPETKSVPSATVILEVLSPSTEQYDRGSKWLIYQALPDLRHFVLVAQDQRRVEAFHRQGAGWHYELLLGPDAVLRLTAIGIELRLDDFYSAIPMLATHADELALQAKFAPALVRSIAEVKGLLNSTDIDAMIAEMDANECKAAIAAIVDLVGTPSRDEWKSVLPERLQDRLDAVLSASTYG